MTDIELREKMVEALTYKSVSNKSKKVSDEIDYEQEFIRVYHEYRDTINELDNLKNKYYDLLERYNKLIEADVEGMRGPYDKRLRVLEDKVRDLMAGFNCDGYCD
jgi:uncharacterized protein YdcH (DUF465 family)